MEWPGTACTLELADQFRATKPVLWINRTSISHPGKAWSSFQEFYDDALKENVIRKEKSNKQIALTYTIMIAEDSAYP